MSTVTVRIPNAAAVSSSAEHKPILAERFKTKMCQNYEKTGVCPYETRCMFAHGSADLRTKEMNLADNLVTEDAIKAFQRAKVLADREKQGAKPAAKASAKPVSPKQQPKATAVAKQLAPVLTKPATPAKVAAAPAKVETPVIVSPVSPQTPRTEAAAQITPRSEDAPTPKKAPTAVATPSTASRRYRHDPYAPVVIGAPVSYYLEEYTAYAEDYYYPQQEMPMMAPVSNLAAAMLAKKIAATAAAEPCYCAGCCSGAPHIEGAAHNNAILLA